MAYDSRCYDLAETFLADEPALQTENKKKALAQTIQTSIEDWIQWEHDHAATVQSAPKTYDDEMAQAKYRLPGVMHWRT